ncbi:MAG TPA: hypothetical protein QGH10_23620, partial [Armatimonadota bacterium]|nr:hypothetical protein [Armatimonadota bacterium]
EAVVDASDFAGVAGEAGDAEVDAWLACLMAADLQSDDGDASFQAALEHLRSLAPVDPRTWAAVVSGPSGPVQVAVPRADSDSEPTPLKPWHRAALEEAIAQGRAAEPDNGLWDSTGLVLAVVDDDIDSAVRHLERAVAADGYDEHASDLADAVCRASEALGQYPFRARLTALEQARPGRPGASLRVAVRHLAAEVAARHEAHGRHEEALSIYASLLRLNGLVTESPLWEGFGTWRYPPPWVARATWRGRYAATTPDSDSQAHRSVAALREFVSYCVSHGRSDLADKALATSAKGARAAGAASHGTEGWRKVEAPLLTAILGWYLGEGMLALAIVLTLVALGLHLARFLVLRRRTGRATAAALSALLCLAVCTLPAHATIYSGETSPWEAAMPYICAGALLVLLGIAVGWCYLRHPRGPGRLPATLADLSSGAWLLSKVCWTSFALLALTTGGLQAYALHWMLRGSG